MYKRTREMEREGDIWRKREREKTCVYEIAGQRERERERPFFIGG